MSDGTVQSAPGSVEPLLPSVVDVSTYPWAPVRLDFLSSHSLALLPDPEPFRALVLLASRAWTQKPSMSLPADDARLAWLAGFGRDVHAWLAIKEKVMAEWVLATDGRWYHEELARWARQSWASKQSAENFSEKQRQRALARPSRSYSNADPLEAPGSLHPPAPDVPFSKPGLSRGSAARKPLRESKKDIDIQSKKGQKDGRRNFEQEKAVQRSAILNTEAHGELHPPSLTSSDLPKTAEPSAPEPETLGGSIRDDVNKVFEHWCTATGRPDEILDASRLNKIKACLQTGTSVEVICKAIDGACVDDFYQGRTSKQPFRIDTIDIICKDRDRILRLASVAEKHRKMSFTEYGEGTSKEDVEAFMAFLESDDSETT